MAERTEHERARLLEDAVERGMARALVSPDRKEIIKSAVREVLAEQDPEERKVALKEVYKEILTEQLARFGGFALGMIGVTVVVSGLGLLLYFMALKAGWTPPK